MIQRLFRLVRSNLIFGTRVFEPQLVQFDTRIGVLDQIRSNITSGLVGFMFWIELASIHLRAGVFGPNWVVRVDVLAQINFWVAWIDVSGLNQKPNQCKADIWTN